MRLFVARHGQTSWNILGKAQGHTDIPLDEVGQAQALALARALSDLGVERVVSSDLLRARQTAEAVAGPLGLSVEVRHDLRERSFGEWEGRHYTQVIADLDALPGDRLLARPPGGESFTDLWTRVGPAVQEFRAFDCTTLVVCHGALKATLLARMLDGTLDTARFFRFPNCALTTFGRRSDGSLYLERYAETFA